MSEALTQDTKANYTPSPELCAARAAYPSPLSSFEATIEQWEGEYQDNPDDRGNYAHGHDGSVRLVGTMRGVTPDAYAASQGIDPGLVTAAMMRAITLETAARIAMSLYYVKPRLHQLTWPPLVAITVDIAWGSGVQRGLAMLQQLIRVSPDGEVSAATEQALDAYLEAVPIASSCKALVQMRESFYVSISPPGSRNARFRTGWLNRARWFSPANSEWWAHWVNWSPPPYTGGTRPVTPPDTFYI